MNDGKSDIAKPGELVEALGKDAVGQRQVDAGSLLCPKCGSERTSGRSAAGGRTWRVCLECGNTFSGTGTVAKTEAKRSQVSKDFKDKSKIHSLKEIGK